MKYNGQIEPSHGLMAPSVRASSVPAPAGRVIVESRSAGLVAASVLPFDGGRSEMLFASLVPRCGGPIAEQFADIFLQLDSLLAAHGFDRGDIVKGDIFLADPRTATACRALFRSYCCGTMPAASLIMQPPAGGFAVALEILAIHGETVRVERISEHLTVVRDMDRRWAYVGGIEPRAGATDTYAQALSCFEQLHEELARAGMHFKQVVRTWIYERDIIAMEKSVAGVERQRYQILNDARRQFFTRGDNGGSFHFSHDLPPASTGIGMSGGAFVMECLALDVPKGAIEITPLNNPEQIDAHAYSQEVLERGAAAIKAAPLFSRGMSIRGDYRMLLISGTASIKGQETVCINDAAGQTKTTLENIGLVLAQAEASLRDVQQARVYIKSSPRPQELADRIRAIQPVVDATLPGIPKLFLVADVCRDNLLVEIEALSFVKTHPAASRRVQA